MNCGTHLVIPAPPRASSALPPPVPTNMSRAFSHFEQVHTTVGATWWTRGSVTLRRPGRRPIAALARRKAAARPSSAPQCPASQQPPSLWKGHGQPCSSALCLLGMRASPSSRALTGAAHGRAPRARPYASTAARAATAAAHPTSADPAPKIACRPRVACPLALHSACPRGLSTSAGARGAQQGSRAQGPARRASRVSLSPRPLRGRRRRRRLQRGPRRALRRRRRGGRRRRRRYTRSSSSRGGRPSPSSVAARGGAAAARSSSSGSSGGAAPLVLCRPVPVAAVRRILF